MKQYGIFYDGEAQTRSARFPASALIHPVETVENTFQVFFFDSTAGIVELKIVKFAVFHIIVDTDRDIFSGIVDLIVYQVPENGIK